MTTAKSPSSSQERDTELLSGRQKQLIRQALTARFSAFLKPGESLEVDAEKSADYVYGTITVTSADKSFRLDIEAAILAADQATGELGEPDAYLELALEFLKLQLYEFFRQDRQERFHIDWRLYPTEKATIRFKGQIRKPTLEHEADELLDGELPDPDDELADGELLVEASDTNA